MGRSGNLKQKPMKIIKEIEYKGYTISVKYNKETDMFSANSLLGNSHNKFDSKLKNFCHGFETPKEAIDDVKTIVDEMLSKSYTSLDELANAITNNLTWTGYEDCHLESKVLKTLLDNYKPKTK
jgi:hypothetical protein